MVKIKSTRKEKPRCDYNEHKYQIAELESQIEELEKGSVNLTKRDQFAIAALPAIIARMPNAARQDIARPEFVRMVMLNISRSAYEIADAMMKTRLEVRRG